MVILQIEEIFLIFINLLLPFHSSLCVQHFYILNRISFTSNARKIENVTSHDNDKVVVYFGGDVQDLEVNMSKHRDNKNYSHWSLEKTAMLLSKASSYNGLPNHLL